MQGYPEQVLASVVLVVKVDNTPHHSLFVGRDDIVLSDQNSFWRCQMMCNVSSGRDAGRLCQLSPSRLPPPSGRPEEAAREDPPESEPRRQGFGRRRAE